MIVAPWHKIFLEALGKGHVVTTRFLREVAAEDETMLDDLLKASVDTFPARDFDTKALRKAVGADLAKLLDLRAKAAKVSAYRDPKLKVLVAELEKIAAQAKEEAADAIDESQRRKVLLFSFFADTVEYVRKFLRDEVERNPALSAYHNRVVAVTGDDDLEETSRQDAIYGFAPISAEAPPGRDDDLYDILVTTDVLAEGVNLQQCRNIINLDIPWNPMRLVQRHGRIDRIGSPHPRVFLRGPRPVRARWYGERGANWRGVSSNAPQGARRKSRANRCNAVEGQFRDGQGQRARRSFLCRRCGSHVLTFRARR